jgi:lipoate-protein ligase A
MNVKNQRQQKHSSRSKTGQQFNVYIRGYLTVSKHGRSKSMSTWRLLKLETRNAFMNMAIDEAILQARINRRVSNTLRFYRWDPSAVSVGKFQTPQNEVYLDNCRKLGVDVVRRITGGGTVYHDAGDEVTYSVIARTEDLGVAGIAAVYARVYAGIAEALRVLGITADFNEGDAKNCPNLTVKGKKISGSAQAHRSGIVLQHGTLLLNVDLERMFTLLRVPWAKTCMEVVEVAKNRITSIRSELGHAVSAETASNALSAGFGNAFGVQLTDGELTRFERELAEALCREKYATGEWNFHGKSALG